MQSVRDNFEEKLILGKNYFMSLKKILGKQYTPCLTQQNYIDVRINKIQDIEDI